MNTDNQIFVEDVIGDLANRKIKVNSKKKGNRVELELTKILTARFNQTFSRSVGSGNRWGQVSNLPSHAKTTLTGDICPPEGFKWVIECKGGYEKKTDLNGFTDGIAQLDEFIAQSIHDAESSNRLPIIMWKRSRKPWLTMVRDQDIEPLMTAGVLKVDRYMKYQGWTMLDFQLLLNSTPDDYWFEIKDKDVATPST